MRVRKTVKIDKEEFTIRELTLREIINFLDGITNKASDGVDEVDTADTMSFIKGEIETLLNLALEGDRKVDDFLDMAPSELKLLYDTFHEVNKVFFVIAAQMGLSQGLKGIADLIREEFSKLLVTSSKAAIVKS